MMGSPKTETARDLDEHRHKVTLTKDFWMMEHEVTQEEWKAVMEENPSAFDSCGTDCPVENISWQSIQIFIQRVSIRDGVQYRLPTEAEWEYAARGSEAFLYSGGNNIDVIGWYGKNSTNTTHSVCQKQRNGYGLCDMTGNVSEWVADWYGEYATFKNLFKINQQKDPNGNESGSARVIRGGSWAMDASYSRIACRTAVSPDIHGGDIGFRLNRLAP